MCIMRNWHSIETAAPTKTYKVSDKQNAPSSTGALLCNDGWWLITADPYGRSPQRWMYRFRWCSVLYSRYHSVSRMDVTPLLFLRCSKTAFLYSSPSSLICSLIWLPRLAGCWWWIRWRRSGRWWFEGLFQSPRHYRWGFHAVFQNGFAELRFSFLRFGCGDQSFRQSSLVLIRVKL